MSSNLIRCQNGHLFSARRYGTVRRYMRETARTQEKKETAAASEEAIEELLFAQETAPVCGWVVCVSGPRQGEDYKIRSGKNFIGRADDMDIQILGDNKISRRNHGVLVFDPKNRETVLLPGDSNGLVYHEGKAVYTPVTLNPYDVIEMGESKFAFVPFCGENFMWQEKGRSEYQKPGTPGEVQRSE